MASVLGVSTDHAARVLRMVSEEPQIRGVDWRHLFAAMERLGAHVRYTSLHTPYEVLAMWLADNLQQFKANHLILQFGVADDSHYGTISGGMYQCNLSRMPVPLEAIPFRPTQGIVYGVFEVLDRPLAVPCDDSVSGRSILAKARRLAARFGVVVHSSAPGHYEVWCPELDHDDPLEGRNATDDVRVVLELVEEYRDCLQGGYLEAVTAPCLL